MLLIVLVLNLIAAAMVLEFEGGNPDANIDSYPDALYFVEQKAEEDVASRLDQIMERAGPHRSRDAARRGPARP